jgi:hypothetical protein
VSGPTQQGGPGRVGIVENWELRKNRKQDANSGAFKGLVFVGVALVLIVIGGWYAARPMIGPASTVLSARAFVAKRSRRVARERISLFLIRPPGC